MNPYEHVLSSSRNRLNPNVPLFACYLNKISHTNHFETNHDQTQSFVPQFWRSHVIQNSENSLNFGQNSVFVNILTFYYRKLWNYGALADTASVMY